MENVDATPLFCPFDSWIGGLTSGLNPVTFIMDKDKTIITTFNPNYKMILLPGGTPFASIQDAYASVSTGMITIQAQVMRSRRNSSSTTIQTYLSQAAWTGATTRPRAIPR